jgi:signal transduction histidine kinase
MAEAKLVWIDQGMTQSSVGTGTVELDLCDLGIVVLDGEGRVASTNDRARQLLRADSQSALEGRLPHLQRALAEARCLNGVTDETSLELAGVGALCVRSCPVAGINDEGQVLLLRDARALTSTTDLLQQAARHRSFAFLARDWAHDLKGMLHVIRINCALLGRLLQRASPTIDPAMTRCLDAIPREVQRLDHSIELILRAKHAEQPSTFDIGAMCERLKHLIAARAARHRVEVVLELNGGSKEIVGFEDVVEGALLNVIVNALEAMPEEGRLVITVNGGAAGVTVRVADSGAGMQPQRPGRQWRPQFVNGGRQTGIGLHVTHAIVESHGGRIECASNVPRGTSIEITFPPAASTGRLGHGSRTHR